MCRLLATSKIQVFNYDLEELQYSQGGEGDGFITFKQDTPTTDKKNVFIHREKKNDIYISKFLAKGTLRHKKKTLKTKQKTYSYYSASYNKKIITYERIPHTFLYHTRLVSSGYKSLQNNHPAIGKRYLVMQNGTELFTYQSIADYESVLNLLEDKLIKPQALAYITTSNWIIVDTKKKKIYFISAKTYDPLKLYFEAKNKFIIASEPILSKEAEKWYQFSGIAKARYDIENNEIILEYLPEIENYVPKKHNYYPYGYYDEMLYTDEKTGKEYIVKDYVDEFYNGYDYEEHDPHDPTEPPEDDEVIQEKILKSQQKGE